MDRSTEIRIFLVDTECELRFISAASVLEARRESRRIFAEYGGDDYDRHLIESACVVAAGLYIDGSRPFSGGMDVLSALTPEEILSAAGEYDMPAAAPAPVIQEEEIGRAAVQSTEEVPHNERTTKSADEDGGTETADIREQLYAQKRKRSAKFTEMSGDKPSKAVYFETGKAGGAIEEKAFFEREIIRDFKAPEAFGLKSGPEEQTAANGVFTSDKRSGSGYLSELKAISGFFERDSRRYDGVFTYY